jgi:hypothetical protein
MKRSNEDADTLVAGPVEDFRSDQFRTRFAEEAVNLAELFELVIGTTPLRGPTTFHVQLAAPEGPSTGGGVQSVQHLRLVAADGGATLVAGWCDQTARSCELRTLECLDAQHRQRFARSTLQAPPIPSERIDRVQYGQLLERLRGFFSERGLAVVVVDSPEVDTRAIVRTATRPRPTTSPNRLGWVALGALLGGVLVALTYWLALR